MKRTFCGHVSCMLVYDPCYQGCGSIFFNHSVEMLLKVSWIRLKQPVFRTLHTISLLVNCDYSPHPCSQQIFYNQMLCTTPQRLLRPFPVLLMIIEVIVMASTLCPEHLAEPKIYRKPINLSIQRTRFYI